MKHDPHRCLGGDPLEVTKRAQAEAADPDVSAWVSANAGAGKTHVLTLRMLRLMLNGAPPDRILCLTYTKAAAAEMSKRVFDALAKWATADEAELAKHLAETLGRSPRADDVDSARTLFARAIETPGGLKVQTIHAFAERLLQRFPLEAGVTPGFKILDEAETREVKARAIDATLVEATASPTSALGKALQAVIGYAADANFDALLSKAIEEREWLDAASRIELGAPGDDFVAVEALLRDALDLTPDATVETTQIARASLLSDAELRDMAGLLRAGGPADRKCAAAIDAALAERSTASRSDRLEGWLLTSTGGERMRLFSAALEAARPDLAAVAAGAQRRFSELTAQLRALKVVTANAALHRLAGAVLHRFAAAKEVSGALDFEDLIVRATSLLTGRRAADWVLYKLDGGLDHILVDEAQDTSPAQWRIVEALTTEFFSGEGAREQRRTVFAVGDEKQSIYSFQGAAPEKFSEMGRRLSALADSAKAPWRRVALHLSYRSVAPVLQAVDAVFADAQATPGVGDPVVHAAKRLGCAGLVEIWPVETPVDAEPADAWKPLEDKNEQAPANRVADQIADTISNWLATGEILKSEGRPVRPGDILILVRKRVPFAAPMVAALKRRDIPVAGADRMTLIDQIAVQDLMALGDFLALPEDDLALASVLKGPLFNLDDDDLLAIAVGRKGTLWKALLARANDSPKFAPAAEALRRWRAKINFSPPFEFFSSLLDRDGGRARLLRRLGPEASDALDEFLDLALAYDDRDAPSLEGFLADLRAARSVVKRDLDLERDEVRVMTVHGAKGLEAPIVFLPDTCATANGDSMATRLLKLPGLRRPVGLPDPILWPVKGSSNLPAVRRAAAAKQQAETEERNRLLYVAMTRARDRLYVAGFDSRAKRPEDCWYNCLVRSLTPLMVEMVSDGERRVFRLETPQITQIEGTKVARRLAAEAEQLPAFALRRAPHEPQLSVPLAPSRLEPYAPDSEGEPIAPRAAADPAVANDAPTPLLSSDARRFLRGTITHALLQHLPEVPPAQRKTAAEAFVARRGAALSESVQRSIVAETLAILTAKGFAPLFGPGSRAEVAISASLSRPSGAGPALRLSGQIDRLTVTSDCVLIVDYKTNRPAPSNIAAVADAYLFQLAAYVLALREIYPGKTVRAGLLWTDGPRLMEIPEKAIDDAIGRLWDLDVASLDAP